MEIQLVIIKLAPIIFGKIGESDIGRKSGVISFRFIALLSTELNCVYSASKFIFDAASRNGKLPVYTFDQDLWGKSLLVTDSPNCYPGTTARRLRVFKPHKFSWFCWPFNKWYRCL